MYKMKMSNLLDDAETFSLCHKYTLFQAEFQQYKWKSLSSFLTDKLGLEIFISSRVLSWGLCPRTLKLTKFCPFDSRSKCSKPSFSD